MPLGGGMSCVKYLMFGFNLLFAISGLILLGVGSYIYHNMSHYVQWMDIGLISSPIILIAVGIVIFVVAFFGCCGAAKENHCMIMTFAVLLLAIFAVEVSVGVAGYVKHGELEDLLSQRFNDSIKAYDTHPDVKKTFDIMQTELHCCGANGPQDWLNEGKTIPDSCCASGLSINDDGVEKCNTGSPNIHNEGCLGKLLAVLRDNALVLGGVGLGIALVQLLGVIFACGLARSIRKEYETV